MPISHRIPRVLSIAGSDSGAGAGIQADLKAFAACGVHGMTAITAITAQNTTGVTAVHAIPPDVIVAQVRAVATDIGIDAVKIGMLGDRSTILAVAQALDEVGDGVPVVLDPVMVAESGAHLLEAEARATLIDLLLPRATVVTPNVPEARALVAQGRERQAAEPRGGERRAAERRGAEGRGAEGRGADPQGVGLDVEELARAIHAMGPEVVVVTGGHRDKICDVFFDGRRVVELPGPRHPDGAAHGSGCTHSSVLAARLAHGDAPLEAARAAQEAASRAVAQGLREIGAGPGPVDILGIAAKAGQAEQRDRRSATATRRKAGGVLT